MHIESTLSLGEEVMRLARRIHRYTHHNKGHVTREDRLLQLLLVNDGISLRDLARLMDMRPPSVSEWLDKLLASEEITKEQDTEDRRMVRISLTAKGRERALAAEAKAKHSVGIFAGCLEPSEEKAFIDSCRRLHQHLDDLRRHKQGHGHKLQGHHTRYTAAENSDDKLVKIKKE